MRLKKIDLLEDSAKLLKQYLPKLNGLTEYERSEIFTIYSMLKYLTMEFRNYDKYSIQKELALLELKQKITETFIKHETEMQPVKSLSQLELMDILTFVFETNLSKEMKLSLSDYFIQYFNDVNQAEMQMFK